VAGLGKLVLVITLAGSCVAVIPRLRLAIRLFLPEYRERRKQLLSMKAKKLIHRYGESVLSTWEISFAAVEWQSAIAARLLSPDGLADRHTVEAAFGVLQMYSPIQQRDDCGGYVKHKLVHAWGQDRPEVEQQ
jgi:hypothetical protein